MMTNYEQLRKRLSYAVAVDDIEEKTRALEEVQAPRFFDGLSEIEVMKLRTIVSDIWRTRLEVSFQEIRQKVPA
jgi:hypothetical protein